MLSIIVGLRYTVRGREHLNAATSNGACIIACKHQSAFDTIFISLLSKDIVIISKGQLASVPLFGYYLKKLDTIFIDRENKASAIRDLMRQSRNAVANNQSLFIFPEGTRTKPEEIVPYQRGISLLYKDLNVPVVPIALNTGMFWGRKSFFKHRGQIIIDIQPAIAPGLERDQFMDVLQRTIDTASAKLLNTQSHKKIWFKRIVTFLATIIIAIGCAGYISVKKMIDQRLEKEGIQYTDSKLHFGFSTLPFYELINVSAESPDSPGSDVKIKSIYITPTGRHKVTIEAKNISIRLYGVISSTITQLEAFIEQSKQGKSIPYIQAKGITLNVGSFKTIIDSIDGNYKHKQHSLNFSCSTPRSKQNQETLLFIKSLIKKEGLHLNGEIDIQTTFGDQFILALHEQGMITLEKMNLLKSDLKKTIHEKNTNLKQIKIIINH
ncbi:MAG: lysophospholipid acyltransferase family protein [Candidatus Paracaedibacteraceae bacterium]|nr:lysophospholipid acyltransferase family protein [Candidatus Paracaedibacteraceae bacterium]